jgi:hypothetical protein
VCVCVCMCVCVCVCVFVSECVRDVTHTPHMFVCMCINFSRFCVCPPSPQIRACCPDTWRTQAKPQRMTQLSNAYDDSINYMNSLRIKEGMRGKVHTYIHAYECACTHFLLHFVLHPHEPVLVYRHALRVTNPPPGPSAGPQEATCG